MTHEITLNARMPESVNLSGYIDQQKTTGNTTQHFVVTIAPHQTITVYDDLHEQTLFKTKIEFVLQENSKLLYHMKITGESVASLIEKELIVRLMGAGGYAEIIATCLGTEKQIFKFKTLQDHQAEKATSKVLIKGVLDDEATLYCHSLIYVSKQAQQTLAEQANKNILLSRSARAVSVPTLEVLANDVRCKHGAAVSRLNDEQLFYLQSRGMNALASRKMLIQAFLN